MGSHCHNQCCHFPRSSSCSMVNQSPSGCCCCNKCTTPPTQPVSHDSNHILQSLALLLHDSNQMPNVNAHYFSTGPQTQKSRPASKTRVVWDSPSLGESRVAIASLVQRICYLESLIRQYPPCSKIPNSCSLREAAARVIQSSFRSFLVRRSRALRHLQELGRLKKCLLSLKSQVSTNMYVDLGDVSLKAMNLMREIELIEDDHYMITDGKWSIKREIMTFLDHIGGASPVNSRKSIYSSIANVRREAETLKDLRHRVEMMDRCLPSNGIHSRIGKHQNKKQYRSDMAFDNPKNKNKAVFTEDVNLLDVFEDGGGAAMEEFDEGEDCLGIETQLGKSFKKLSCGYDSGSHVQDASFRCKAGNC